MNSTKYYHTDLYFSLRRKAFHNPQDKTTRPDLVKFIHYLVSQANKLSEEDLLTAEGWRTASDICAVLLTYDLCESEWMTPENEPVLYELFEYSGTLDGDANDPKAWQKLFVASNKLR